MGIFQGRKTLVQGLSAGILMTLIGATVVSLAPSANAAESVSLFRGVDTSSAKSDPERNAVELGLRIRPNINGSTSTIRFLKSPDDKANTHTVNVWSEDGRLLATGRTLKESRRGWQQGRLSKPLALQAGKTYVISYNTGRYMASGNYFTKDIEKNGITVFGSQNGVYSYGATSTFPTQTFGNSNYWVDLVFQTGATNATLKPTSTTATPTSTVPPSSTSTSTTTSTKPSTSTTSSTTAAPATTSTVAPNAGECSGALHEPGGSDGRGGCWPSANNTGVSAGTQLSDYTGSCTISTAGTVIDSKTVNCNLDIRAKNVVIKNSKINGAIIVDSSRCGTASYSVTDSRIHVGDINLRGLMSCNFTATRVDVSGGQSMAWCDTCTIQDSYLHSPLEDPAGAAANHAAHNSTVRVSKNAVLRHNTFWCAVKEYAQPNGQDTSGCSANQTGYSHDGAAPYNSLIEGNLYMPTTGGYCAYGGSTTGDLNAVHDIVFKDNVFKRGTNKNDKGGYTCGYYGAVSSFDANRPGNQWVNNRYDDGSVLNP
jgi:hypothetical protein